MCQLDKPGHKISLPPTLEADLIRQFVAGVPARTAAELTGVNRNTAILSFDKLLATKRAGGSAGIRTAPFADVARDRDQRQAASNFAG